LAIAGEPARLMKKPSLFAAGPYYFFIASDAILASGERI
jgi:hypothetical protein